MAFIGENRCSVDRSCGWAHLMLRTICEGEACFACAYEDRIEKAVAKRFDEMFKPEE